jgi:hypothetical protein
MRLSKTCVENVAEFLQENSIEKSNQKKLMNNELESNNT